VDISTLKVDISKIQSDFTVFIDAMLIFLNKLLILLRDLRDFLCKYTNYIFHDKVIIAQKLVYLFIFSTMFLLSVL